MTLDSTLDLLYLIIAISVLWIAAMLTWLFFEGALVLRNVNRTIKSIREKAQWVEKKIVGIGDKFEASSAYINTIAKGGQMIAKIIRDRKAHGWDEDEDEDERPRKRRKR